MFYNKLFQLFKFARCELIFILPMITLFTFLNLKLLISDKGSRDASFMDLSDLSLNLFLSAKLSEHNFLL